jgi:hypothetical protein
MSPCSRRWSQACKQMQGQKPVLEDIETGRRSHSQDYPQRILSHRCDAHDAFKNGHLTSVHGRTGKLAIRSQLRLRLYIRLGAVLAILRATSREQTLPRGRKTQIENVPNLCHEKITCRGNPKCVNFCLTQTRHCDRLRGILDIEVCNANRTVGRAVRRNHAGGTTSP